MEDPPAQAHALADPQGNVAPGNAQAGWTENEIAGMASAPVGRRKAHAFLEQWRSENPRGALDPTLRRDIFDWAGYVANHRDRQAIFDRGRQRITKFAIQRIDVVMDTNTKETRVDFWMTGDDGMVVRAHPGTKREAKLVVTTWMRGNPVKGSAVHDVAPPLPAGKGPYHGKGGKGGGKDAPLPPRGDEQNYNFTGVSQADLSPSRVVNDWANRRLRTTGEASQPHKLNVTTEVEDPDWTALPRFSWCLWFKGVQSLAEVAPRVREVWMVRLTCSRRRKQPVPGDLLRQRPRRREGRGRLGQLRPADRLGVLRRLRPRASALAPLQGNFCAKA
jgi:hypothetical protein